ncbi:MAG: RNA methyltransferase [Bacteroidales bacterium]|nr:RNA methyltransferase [Bacteroidales bacterium]
MQDINNGIIKVVRSLAVKKYRDEERLFVAEGTKCVRDTWDYFNCKWLICTRAWHDRLANATMHDKIVLANNQQMSRMSQFSTPSDVIAVYEMPEKQIDEKEVRDGLSIVLDNIQDPGNLGTIIRLADWYGIKNIFASVGTVDVYNHKVVQATMGAISRVQVHYGDLVDLLDDYPELPVWGTFLDGENIYNTALENRGFVVFGNEGQGIGQKVAKKVSKRLLIPSWNSGDTSESLNVGVAAAVVVSEFRRGALKSK